MHKPTREEMLLEMMSHSDYVPMKIKEIANLFQIGPKDRAELEEVLGRLVKLGKVELTKRGKYLLRDKSDLLVGKFIAHKKGFGFVEIEDAEDDLFIAASKTKDAFHGDEVAARVLPDSRGKRPEGEIVEILKRGRTEVVGLFQKVKDYGFVVPDDKRFTKDIFIPKGKTMGAMGKHKVVVRLDAWGDENKNPEGTVTEIIGHISDPSTDILAIVKSLEIPHHFPDEVMAYAEKMPDTVDADEAENRMDIRDWPTVTIDGEDAKDLDDAITLTRTSEGYTLGVHIADVSHYVQEDSPLDKEALQRGTSVYLVDRVIPMLPRKLSNGICSLNAGEDRLALSCIMNVDRHGHVDNYQIKKTLLNVNERMSYTDVSAIIEKKDEAVMARYKDYVPMFMLMQELSDRLRDRRMQRGSIDFDFPESKIKLNEQGEPIEIKAYDRNSATKLIEDFMLLANETVAEHFFWQELPFVYRSHEEPDPERIKMLAQFIYNFGYHIKGKEDVHPREIQKLLADVEGTKEEALISRLALRSMKQARYTTTCDGHYGLSTKYYCHFTSPIRRYPDLQIHRIIKESIDGKMVERRVEHLNGILPHVAAHSSATERRAEQAERETVKLKKAEYMAKHIGETFEGVISGVTQWGLYVELDNTIEGLVHVTAMDDDYYNYDEKKHMFIGERRGNIYTLGDVVRIVVVGANVQERTIDFAISKEENL